MIEEIKAHYEKDGAKAILDRLKRLRRHDGDEASFWGNYLTLVAMLCRSPIAYLMQNDGNEWKLAEAGYDEAAVPEFSSGFIQLFIELIDRAVKNGFAYDRSPIDVPGRAAPFLLAISLEPCGDNVLRGICLIADKSNPQQFSDLVVRAGLVADVPRDYYSHRSQIVPEGAASQEYGLHHLVTVAHGVMAQPRFLMACSTLANEVAQKFSCSRVNVGWEKRGYVRLVAVSHLEEFKPDSPAARRVESIFEEVVDQDTIISVPPEHSHFVVDRAHRDFVAGNLLDQVISIPFYHNEKTVGVLSCEIKGEKLSVQQVDSLSFLLEIVSPWLGELHYRDKWFGARMMHRIRHMSANWFNGERLALKIFLVTAAVLIILSLVVKLDYRVEGTATLQTDLVRFVSAPFDGIIKDVFVREGDQVRIGDRLASLDIRDLQLRRSQEAADIVRFVREADKSRAHNALADMKIAQSRVEELSSELERTDYNLEKAAMTAQSDGIVVEGDTKKLLGAPVSKGDVLMKIARVENMYAMIKIRERDIDEVSHGLSGELVLVSQPESIFTMKIEKMIPLAEIDQYEGNIFLLKANINEQPRSWWRPGMSGVARIDVGRRTIAWMLTHRVIDFIRMYIWW